MIIPFVSRDWHQSHSYVLCLPGSVTRETLLRRAKVKPDSYAGELVTNLHDSIFRQSLELKRDYGEYYDLEYETFGEYLKKRLLFPPEIVDNCSEQFQRSQLMIYFQPHLYFLEDFEYGNKFLGKLLERGSNENPGWVRDK